MQILIDNQDGQGSVDYTGCVQGAKGPVMTRTLNRPTTCTFAIVPALSGLKEPAAGAYVQVLSSPGAALFTGYVCAAPTQSVVGGTASGSVFAVSVEAVSDEIVLDTEMHAADATLLGGSAAASWELLAAASSAATLPLSLSSSLNAPSRVQARPGARWSTLARVMADTTRSAYSAMSGQVAVGPVGASTHTIAADDPGLEFAEPTVDALQWVANDITVCGREEAAAYVTEIFEGDGVTVEFALTDEPFDPTAAERVNLQDQFQGDAINTQLWQVTDPGSYLSMTAAGLSCAGGTGRDGCSVVASQTEIEPGGVITLEAGAVELGAGSSGLILGLYAGEVAAANCVVGFQVSTAGGGVSVTPFVNGSSAGSAFTPAAGSLNTYRIRVYSPETERIGQSYFYEAGGSSQMLGGATVPSQGTIEFEVQSVVSGVPGAPVVLYLGEISLLPTAAVLGVIDSAALVCGIRSVQCVQSFPAWVTAGAPGATPAPQFVAASTDGGACTLSSAGKLAFFADSVPADGALITVCYRSRQYAVARRSLGAAESVGAVQSSLWIGSVREPLPLTSTDCDNAAAALLAMASVPAAGLRGTYRVVVQEGATDIWPGDAISVAAADGVVSNSAIVRSVRVAVQASSPGTLAYTVAFANDAAEELSIQTSSTVPEGAVIPQAPTALGTALLSLSRLTVESVTGAVLTVNTGLTAPVNGGFEVRRRDFTFGAGTDSDLVLRTAASAIAIPRSNAVEQFYLRMYDGAQPPNYSLHSAAVFLNVPL